MHFNAKMDAMIAHHAPAPATCWLSTTREKLHRSGLRMTRQRLMLAALLFREGNRHVSADMLFEEAVAARVPMSRATVYNVLHQFSEAGLIRAICIDPGRVWYDTNTGDHFHYFVEGEERIIDLPAGVAVSHLPVPPEGMEIRDVNVIVRLRPSR